MIVKQLNGFLIWRWIVIDSQVTVSLRAEIQLHMFLPIYLLCRGVGEHAARGHRKQTSGETPGGTLSKSQDRGGVGGRGGFQQPWWDLNRGWIELGLGSGTEEEQASRWRRRACFVPVSIADEVTKTILNSPKALTASWDRCYCPRQSNTTVWIRREKTKQKTTRREYREDIQSSV